MTFEERLRNADPMALPAIASVTVGTTLAAYYVPDDFSAPGAMLICAVIMSAALIIPVLAATVRHPKSLFRADYLLQLGIVYWVFLDLLQSKNEPVDVTHGTVQLSLMAVGLFSIAIWSAAIFKPWSPPALLRDAAEATLSESALYAALGGCFFLGMLHYLLSCDFDVVLMFGSLGLEKRSAPWLVGAADGQGGWDAFSNLLTYFGYFVPTLTVLIAHQRGWHSPGVLVGIPLSLCILVFASSNGTRNQLGVIAGASLLSWLLLKGRMTFWTWVKLLAIVLALLLWMQLMFLYREEGLAKMIDDERIGDRVEKSNAIVVDDNFAKLCYAVELLPGRRDFTYGNEIFYFLVRPVPRVFWPGKPINCGFQFENEYGHYAGSWSLTCIGEFYFDFGFLSIFAGGFFYGRLAGMWNQLLTSRKGIVWPLLYGLGALSLFIGLRSFGEFILRCYPIMFWVILHRFFRGPSPVAK